MFLAPGCSLSYWTGEAGVRHARTWSERPEACQHQACAVVCGQRYLGRVRDMDSRSGLETAHRIHGGGGHHPYRHLRATLHRQRRGNVYDDGLCPRRRVRVWSHAGRAHGVSHACRAPCQRGHAGRDPRPRAGQPRGRGASFLRMELRGIVGQARPRCHDAPRTGEGRRRPTHGDRRPHPGLQRRATRQSDSHRHPRHEPTGRHRAPRV